MLKITGTVISAGPISTGIEYGRQNCIDDIGPNPDAGLRSYDGDRDESNDGYGDGDGWDDEPKGSLF